MTLADEVAPGVDGLAQLRALIGSGRRPGIADALDFTLAEVEPGRAVFVGTPNEHAKVSYLKPITSDTGRLRAEGRVVSQGRRAAFAEATLTDESGRVYATATSTLLIFPR